MAMELSEIAQRFGISRQRVWQIERKALRKLRFALAADPDIAAMVADWDGSRPRAKLSQEMRDKITARHGAGESAVAIGRRLGIDSSTVMGVVQRNLIAKDKAHATTDQNSP